MLLKPTWSKSFDEYYAMSADDRYAFRLCVVFEAEQVVRQAIILDDWQAVMVCAHVDPRKRQVSTFNEACYAKIDDIEHLILESEIIWRQPHFIVDRIGVHDLLSIFAIHPLLISREEYQKLSFPVKGFLKYRAWKESGGLIKEYLEEKSHYAAIAVCGTTEVACRLFGDSQYAGFMQKDPFLLEEITGFGRALRRMVFVIDRGGNVEAF